MTPGPARRMVSLLPRNNPTPMAPPMAIMVSCLWPRRRWRPSASGAASGTATTAETCCSLIGSPIAANVRRFRNQKVDILLKNFDDRLYIIHRVVNMEGDTQAVVAVRGDDVVLGRLLHPCVRIPCLRHHHSARTVLGRFVARTHFSRA